MAEACTLRQYVIAQFSVASSFTSADLAMWLRVACGAEPDKRGSWLSVAQRCHPLMAALYIVLDLDEPDFALFQLEQV